MCYTNECMDPILCDNVLESLLCLSYICHLPLHTVSTQSFRFLNKMNSCVINAAYAKPLETIVKACPLFLEHYYVVFCIFTHFSLNLEQLQFLLLLTPTQRSTGHGGKLGISIVLLNSLLLILSLFLLFSLCLFLRSLHTWRAVERWNPEGFYSS